MLFQASRSTTFDCFLRSAGVAGIAAACLTLGACQSTDNLLRVDDGYTVSQRYRAHKAEFPEIVWPTLSTVTGQAIQFDIPYKDIPGRTLHLDIFSPPADLNNGSAIVLVHGGGWRSGNKSHFYLLANLLAQRGYTVLLPEYRLSVEAPYPAGVIDVADAVAWAVEHSSEYGYDSGRVALGGGSSGGQMAALVAYAADTPLYRPPASPPQTPFAMIDLDGVLDFTTPLALSFENKMKDKSVAGLWLEGAYEKQTARWKEASAATHVDAASPPTLIISSGQDRFTAGREAVLARLTEFGIRNQFIEFDDVLHTFWLFEPYASEVAADIDAFLQLAAGDLQPATGAAE